MSSRKWGSEGSRECFGLIVGSVAGKREIIHIGKDWLEDSIIFEYQVPQVAGLVHSKSPKWNRGKGKILANYLS